MYTVMLIDDDVPMLDYVGLLLKKMEPEVTVISSAYSSEQALELFRKQPPDLVITDIGMPIMDGMELAGRFRELKPDVQLIFLTCYEDFSYSKTAFQLEADDYLIKDELSEEQLAGSVTKSLKKFKRIEALLERHSLRQDIERNRDLLKQTFMKEILSGRNTEETLRFGERLGISWRKPCFLLASLHLDAGSMADRYEYRDFSLIHYAVYNIAADLTREEAAVTPILLQDAGLFLFWNGEAAESAAGCGRLLQYMQQLRENALLFLKVEVTGLYSAAASGLEKLRELHTKLAECRDSGYYDGEAFLPLPSALPVWNTLKHEPFEREQELLLLSKEENNASWIDMAINRIAASSAESQLHPQLLTAQLLRMTNHAAYEWGKNVPEEFPAYLQRAAKAAEAARLTKRQLKLLLLDAPVKEDVQGKDPRLQAIDRYLEEHADEMVTSLDMAEHLHLNASYFSRYFKKLAGINFTDYVNQYKIELAIRMLQRPNETVENVAYTLGFSDRAYFSKVFKKYSGKSPSEFKPPYPS